MSLHSDPQIPQSQIQDIPSHSVDANNPGNSASLPMNVFNAQVLALDVPSTKDWQNAVTPDLRNHLVRKLMQAIFATPDSANLAAIHDKHIVDLIGYAKKIEADFYEMANSRFEYYNLVAEKIYTIQQELGEKRQRCQEQPIALNAGATTSAAAMALEQLERSINERWRQLKTNPDAINSNAQPNHAIHQDESVNSKDEMDDWMIVDYE